MKPHYLRYFTKESPYPFYIHTCTHDPDFEMHTHEDFNELVIILNGSAMHVVDDEHFFIKKGDVFVISNNTSHGYLDTHDFKICNIMFRPENIFTNLLDIRKLAGFHALFVIEPYLTIEQHFSSRLSLSPSDFLIVKNLIDALIEEYDSANIGRHDMIQSLFSILAIFISRKYAFDTTKTTPSLLHIATSVSYMENNFTKIISMDDLALMSGLSTRHFNRLFKETYGTTPVHYLLNLRLDLASYLLRSSDQNITEIALQSGFQDINYFSRAFRKFRNMTPSTYRDEIKRG